MVITLFRNQLREDIDEAEDQQTFERMLALASQMPGFIGIDGYEASDGGDLAVVSFESEETLAAWKDHPEHVKTQQRARAAFYDSYQITVASVIREYSFPQAV